MKKILFILTLFIGQFIYGQQITSTLNANFYVQGISVNETINLEEIENDRFENDLFSSSE